MKRTLHVASLALMVGLITNASPARADDGSEAQALFDEAKQLITQGRWADACPRLARSQQLDPRMTTLFRLAECYEHTARRASAWSAYLGSAAAADEAGESKRAEFAKERARSLEPTLSYLVITASQRPLVVSRDGDRIEEARLGTKIPVDPGDHVVVAEAPGKQRFTMKVVIVEPGTTVVAVPPLADSRPEPAQVAPTGPPPSPSKARPTDAHAANATPDDHAGLRRWSMILAGVGVATAGTGAILHFTASDSPDGCKGSCAAGTGLMVGGALFAATGLAFFLASLGPATPSRVTLKQSPFTLVF